MLGPWQDVFDHVRTRVSPVASPKLGAIDSIIGSKEERPVDVGRFCDPGRVAPRRGINVPDLDSPC